MASASVSRDQQVADLLGALFEEAEGLESADEQGLTSVLDAVFETTSTGFRECVLTVAVARWLNPRYQASKDFYACNPRPLYEHAIRDSLAKHGVPHGQSGPLNVAKAAPRLDAAWAANRRPRTASNAVVELVLSLEAMSSEKLRRFIVALLVRFLREARGVRALRVLVHPLADPQHVADVCRSMIESAPDAGNTAQVITGLLLECGHQAFGGTTVVDGYADRACTTSATSKKLGDITERDLDGVLLAVYEITTKGFKDQRIQEAVASLEKCCAATGEVVPEEVVVVCRAEDVPSDGPDFVPGGSDARYILGTLTDGGVRFVFVSLFEWLAAHIVRLPLAYRLVFLERFTTYVNQPNTSEKVKLHWKALNC